MKLKSIIVICVVSMLFLSCTAKNRYKNRTFKYRVSYPEGYIALNSDIDHEAQYSFLESIKNQNTLVATDNVDVVFCDPSGPAPYYRLISINTIKQVINISKLRKKKYEEEFLASLIRQTGATSILSTGFYTIGRSKVYQVEFTINFEGNEYHSASIILPFAIFPSHLFSTIYRPGERGEAVKKLRDMVGSYKRTN